MLVVKVPHGDAVRIEVGDVVIYATLDKRNLKIVAPREIIVKRIHVGEMIDADFILRRKENDKLPLR